ncbi:MAG: hypothetical protein CME24_03590 [Gemmatimonadetes bacterium]|nr:hypothetical protein [Gemmatimonadota bacterium]
MWASAEAQELDRVSPEHHEKFCLPYERQLLEPFALTGYGCCDDLTGKMDLVSKIPGIRRVSICPFADVEHAAQVLGGDYIFSWKPKPMHLVGDFDEGMIRGYITDCVRVARERDCVLEMILKDSHTCQFQTHRFDAWTRIAREVMEQSCGAPPGLG